jgi:quinol monooxygenase YgiN
MSQLSVIAKLPAAPGKGEELIAALQAALDIAADEPGTQYYVLHVDASNADVVWMYERYEDQAALDAHSKSMMALFPVLGPLLGGAPELHIVTPLGGKGL